MLGFYVYYIFQLGLSQQNVDKDRLSVEINALKHQYAKLRQRQKQAQIILSSKYNKFNVFSLSLSQCLTNFQVLGICQMMKTI